MKIRKNTKEHSAIFEVLKKHESDKNRNKLIKLFTLKAGENIAERKPVEEAKGFADLYYNLNYNSILNNLLDKDHQLNKSDEEEDLYFFESNYADYETPFLLTPEISEEINSLLKNKKFKARAPKSLNEENKEESPVKPVDDETETKERVNEESKTRHLKVVKDEDEKSEEILQQDKSVLTNEAAKVEKSETIEDSTEKEESKEFQVDADLERYFEEVMDLILQWTKDRPLFNRGIEELFPGKEQPDWMKTVNYYSGDLGGEFMLGQNKQHIQYLIENNETEIKAWTSRNKSIKFPDFLVFNLVPNHLNLENVIQTARACREIFEICEIDSIVISPGDESLSILVPLDGKSDFEAAKSLAELLKKLIFRRSPSLVTIDPEEKNKTFIQSSNQIGETFMVPYSINKHTQLVCLPVSLEELDQADIRINTVDNVLKRIREIKVNYDKLLKQEHNAREVFEKLNKRYGFLL
jgi:DNA primase